MSNDFAAIQASIAALQQQWTDMQKLLQDDPAGGPAQPQQQTYGVPGTMMPGGAPAIAYGQQPIQQQTMQAKTQQYPPQQDPSGYATQTAPQGYGVSYGEAPPATSAPVDDPAAAYRAGTFAGHSPLQSTTVPPAEDPARYNANYPQSLDGPTIASPSASDADLQRMGTYVPGTGNRPPQTTSSDTVPSTAPPTYHSVAPPPRTATSTSSGGSPPISPRPYGPSGTRVQPPPGFQAYANQMNAQSPATVQYAQPAGPPPIPPKSSNGSQSLSPHMEMPPPPPPSELSPAAAAAGGTEDERALQLKRLRALHSANAVKQQQLTRNKTAIDIAFILDLTTSMEPWLAQVSYKIKEIMSTIETRWPDSIARVAFIGYQDFDVIGKPYYVVKDFTTAEELQSTLATLRCDGGNDYCEDVLGAMLKVRELSWAAKTRLVIFVADAPAHHNYFHDCGAQNDRYFNSPDPAGYGPEDMKGVLRYLANSDIEMHCFKLQARTDKMERRFKEILNRYAADLYVHHIDQKPEEFLPNVLKAVSSSVVRSSMR
ncbi:hypothetical protein BJ742DRAFT_774438 [Cladochytrium replicatum]|nr:hypothetical protein BJ742DRAFT_774438 [Cladochytrium replicatum]